MHGNESRLAPSERTKIVFGRGSAPDPAGGAHDAPIDTPSLLGDTPPHTLPYRSRHLWRLDPQTIPALFLSTTSPDKRLTFAM